MQIESIKILKKDERGIIYRCDPINYIVRKKGTISADHNHEEEETIYLVEGRAEFTVDKETQDIESPTKFSISSNVYHKLVAKTDIKLIRA